MSLPKLCYAGLIRDQRYRTDPGAGLTQLTTVKITMPDYFFSPVFQFSLMLVCCAQPLQDASYLGNGLKLFLFLFFWRARVYWPLLCLCRPFCMFDRCMDSNPENCRSKQARYQLGHPSPLPPLSLT